MQEVDEIQALVKELEDAETRRGELMPDAYTKTPGVEATPEPDDPGRRAEQRAATARVDEVRVMLRERLRK